MFFYSIPVLHGVTDTFSFLDAPFFTAKVFLGGGDITNFCQLYNLCSVKCTWTVHQVCVDCTPSVREL